MPPRLKLNNNINFFEDLEKDPLAQIEKIYDQLQLPDLKMAMPRFEKYISSLQGYKKNNYPPDAKAIELVTSHWLPFIQRWNYF